MQKALALNANAQQGGLYVDNSMQGAAWQAFLLNQTQGTQILTLTIPSINVSAFSSVKFTQVVVQLLLADGVTLTYLDKASFLTLIQPQAAEFPFAPLPPPIPGQPQQPANLSAATISWIQPGSGPQSWQFSFSLTNPNMSQLLTYNQFIDGTKLLGIRVAFLYEAQVNWPA